MKTGRRCRWLLGLVLVAAAASGIVALLGTAEASVSTCHDCNNVCSNIGDWGCCVDFPGHGCIAWGVCI